MSKTDRRAQLLTVAAKLFAESSYGGVTTSLLAKAAGVSEPVLYQHFTNKEHLYQQVLQEGCEKTLVEWDRIRAETKSPIDAVLKVVRQQFSVESELWTFYKLHLRAVSEAQDTRVSEILNVNNTRYHDFLRVALQEAQVKGELRNDVDVSDLAWLLLSQGLMLNYSRQIGLKGLEHSGYLDRLLRQALGVVNTNAKR